jgi:hypothetical protein
MAVEFTLQNGRWSAGALKKLLESWAPTCPIPLRLRAPWSATAGVLRTWIFGEGSTRGVHIVRRMSVVKGATLHVRLGAMSSRADWTIAFAFLRTLLNARGGRVLAPDGQVMRPEHLGEEDAANGAHARMYEDAQEILAALQRGERYALLPTPGFDLLVTEAMIPKESDPARLALALDELLREMAGRYQQATVVPSATLPSGQSLSLWSSDGALLTWADFIGVRPGPDAEEGVVLSSAAALQLLGTRLEVVSESLDRFYLPALDPANAADRVLEAEIQKAGTPIRTFLAQFQRQPGGVA